MPVVAEWIRYGGDRTYSGYLAYPERVRSALPAVIVIQEIWGVDVHIEELTRRFAAAGYVALAPDLYAENGVRPKERSAERIEKVKKFLETVPPTVWNNAEERERAMAALPEPDGSEVQGTFGALFANREPAKHLAHLRAAVAYLQSECEHSRGQKVGSVGFCMGGSLSGALAAAEPQLSGAVIFYGDRPTEEQIGGIQCPVMGFYGSLDPRITDAVPGFARDMQAQGKAFQYTIYDGAHHAFFNDTRASYHPAAARDAFAKTLSFFQQQLSESTAVSQG